MSSFDSKWGTLPDEISQKNSSYIISLSQFIICFSILMTLQPPFITVSKNDDYSQPNTSIVLVVLVCLACVTTSFIMNNNIISIFNSFKKNN